MSEKGIVYHTKGHDSGCIFFVRASRKPSRERKRTVVSISSNCIVARPKIDGSSKLRIVHCVQRKDKILNPMDHRVPLAAAAVTFALAAVEVLVVAAAAVLVDICLAFYRQK